MKRVWLVRPLHVVAALACSAAIAFASAHAQAQVFPNGSGYGNNYGDRPIDGTVTSFNQFDLQLATNTNGTRSDDRGREHGNRGRHRGWSQNQQNNGYGSNPYGNPNDTGQGRRTENDNDNDDNDNDGEHGDRNSGQYGYGGHGNQGYGYGGNVMSIHLHQGTIINPRGTTLQNGMRVHVIGHPNGDGTFEADEIDVRNYNG